MNATMWLGCMKEYASQFHVYAVDIPGEPGKSFEEQMELQGASYVTWLKDLMDKIGIHKAHFVGISLGGWMALNFAIQCPDNVKKLVLISPSGMGKIPLFLDQQLKELPMPVSIFVGEKDIMLSSAGTIQRMKEFLPKTEINDLKNEGHSIVNHTTEIMEFLMKEEKEEM